jgi:hypothetical protein
MERKNRKEIWQIDKKIPGPDLYAEEGLSYISAILCFLGVWKLGCLDPLHSKHLKTQNWPFSYTK